MFEVFRQSAQDGDPALERRLPSRTSAVRCVLLGRRDPSLPFLGPGLALLGFEVVAAESVADFRRHELGASCVGVLQSRRAGGAVAELRSSGFRGAILVLSDKADRRREVAALDAGADDFIAPVDDLQVLRARIAGLTRRKERPVGAIYVVGPLRIDEGIGALEVAGRSVNVSSREVELLVILARRRGEVVTRREIMTAWGNPDLSRNAADVYIGRLRRKLGSAGRLLKTYRGRGFALAVDGARSHPTDRRRGS